MFRVYRRWFRVWVQGLGFQEQPLSEVLLDVKELAVRVLHNLYTPKSEPMKSLQVVGTRNFLPVYYEIL